MVRRGRVAFGGRGGRERSEKLGLRSAHIFGIGVGVGLSIGGALSVFFSSCPLSGNIGSGSGKSLYCPGKMASLSAYSQQHLL